MIHPQIFEKPAFVTPHAVAQFQEKILDAPAAVIIPNIQASLQLSDLVDLPIYRGYYAGRVFYAIVAPAPAPDKWPSVVTILGKESRIHNKLMKERRLR